jgi:hypothetical protein
VIAKGFLFRTARGHDGTILSERIVRLTYRIREPRSRLRDHTAATAFRHSLAASARKIRSVDRETRWR